MTQQVFYQDSYKSMIETCIDAVDLIDGCTAIILESNIFHVEGGGQPSDYGEVVISGINYPVKTILKRKGQTFLLLDHEIPSSESLWGEQISCSIDWERRYKLMRYHTCGHVLMSSVRHIAPGYEPKGMKIQEDLGYGEITFLTHQEMSKDQVIRILDIAESAIKDDLKVEARNYSSLEAAKLENEDSFRVDSNLNLKGKVRVVVINDFDANPCGGTHVKSLKEIGKINIELVSYDEISHVNTIKFTVL
jgi:misacylated tRNA(Ala) deacylase